MSDITLDELQLWLDRYIEAWRTHQPDLIGGLFTEAATYRHRPLDDAITGREAIVADWLEDPDEAGSWTADYAAWAVSADRAVAIGETKYGDSRYSNVFLMRFDNGRCSDFVEYWMIPRGE